MKEKDFDKKKYQEENKLKWEAPKLYCLDKGKTEGGLPTSAREDTGYYS